MSFLAITASIIILLAALAYFSTNGTLRDVFSGKPCYLSLMDYTSIFDRNEMKKHFGEPDKDDRYIVTPEKLFNVKRTIIQRIYSTPFFDGLCIVSCIISIWGIHKNYGIAACLITLAGAYQALGWYRAVQKVFKAVPHYGKIR